MRDWNEDQLLVLIELNIFFEYLSLIETVWPVLGGGGGGAAEIMWRTAVKPLFLPFSLSLHNSFRNLYANLKSENYCSF